MSRTLEFRLGEIFADPTRCSFLDDGEIEPLVDGTLSQTRQREWDGHAASCAACAELKRDLESLREIEGAGLTVGERRRFREADARTAPALGIGGRSRPRRRFWIWLPGIAAALVLAIWVGRGPGHAIPVEAFPLLPPPAVRGADQADTWSRLEALWADDEMREAAAVLERAVGERPDEADLWFYLGLARLRAGQAEAAVEALEHADRLQASTLPSEHTRWMLAAAYERSGRKADACEMLDSVVGLDGTRAAAARGVVGSYCDEAGSAP